DGEAPEPDMGRVLLLVMGVVNQWREVTEWPLSRAVDTDVHLRADGRLTQAPPPVAEQPEEFTYDPMNPVPTTGGAPLLTDEYRRLPSRADRPDGSGGARGRPRLHHRTAHRGRRGDRPDPGGALRRHGRTLDRLGGPPVRRRRVGRLPQCDRRHRAGARGG